VDSLGDLHTMNIPPRFLFHFPICSYIKLCSVVVVILDVRSEPYDNCFSCITIHRWFQQIFGSISHVVSEDIFFEIWPEKRELPVATILTYSFLQSVILIVTGISEEMINMYYVNSGWQQMPRNCKKILCHVIISNTMRRWYRYHTTPSTCTNVLHRWYQ